MPETPLTFADVLIEELARIRLRREKLFAQLSQSTSSKQARAALAEDPTTEIKTIVDKIETTDLTGEIRGLNHERPQDVANEVNEDERLAAARIVMLKEDLAGLAFSGGGIRSATFAVGILQGLASLKLLRFFDVLSTVSGGGYAGGWVAAWMQREGDPLNVERQLNISRVRQAESSRLANVALDVQLFRIVEEELRGLLDRSVDRIVKQVPRAARGQLSRKISAILGDLRETISREVPDHDEANANGAVRRHSNGVHQELDSHIHKVHIHVANRIISAINELPLSRAKKGQVRQKVERIIEETFGTEWKPTINRIHKRIIHLFGIGDDVARIVVEELESLPICLTGAILQEMREWEQDRVRGRLAEDPREIRAGIGLAVSAFVDKTLATTFIDEASAMARNATHPLRNVALRHILCKIIAYAKRHEPNHDTISIRERGQDCVNQGCADLDDQTRDENAERAIEDLDRCQKTIMRRVRQLLDSYTTRSACDQVAAQMVQVVDEEPEPIRHLRRYSSYLNPRPGLFSTDTWTLVAIYTRNVLINFLLILPLILFVVLTVRLVILGYDRFNAVPHSLTLGQAREQVLLALSGSVMPHSLTPDQDREVMLASSRLFLVLGLGLGLFAFVINGLALWRLRIPKRGSHLTSHPWNLATGGLLMIGAILWMMAYPPILYPIGDWLETQFGRSTVGNTGYPGWPNVWGHILFFGALMGLFSAVMSIGSRFLTTQEPKIPGSDEPHGNGWQYQKGALVAGVTFGAMIAVVEALLRSTVEQRMPWYRVLAGPPLLLGAIVVAVAAQVATVGPEGTEGEREWWGQFSARLMLLAIYWLVVVGVVVYGPAVLLGSHFLLASALGSGWVATTVAGVLAGKSGATANGEGDKRLEWLALVAPPVFLSGLLAIVSTITTFWLSEPDDFAAIKVQATFSRAKDVYLSTLQTADVGVVLWWVGSFVVYLVAEYLVHVNLFSLNAMYANRLTRAFLGASRRNEEWGRRWGRVGRDQRVLAGAPTGAVDLPRDPNPITGFDPDDDLDLFRLRIGEGDAGARYWGPHVIFNTALNLVGGDELAWRDRKAESFILTPLHCGARTTGYARTPEGPAYRMSVGRAISVSGAAVDPNMNFHQSPAVTALLTVFNARLGIWIQNPNPETWWKREWKKTGVWRAEPASYGRLILKELFGETNEKGDYVHISDGGHFDNLGVYELVRRRCRYIVAVDAAENPLATSDNLGILVRLCRIDLGLRIELDTVPLKVVGPDGISRTHVVVGRIRYDDVDNGQTPGLLIYIKSTMTGNEPPDVQQYANLHPEFPRQLTLTDQSFDEDQFESYRALGAHVAHNVFESAAQSTFRKSKGNGESPSKGNGESPSKDEAELWWSAENWTSEGARAARVAFSQGHRKIFAALRNRWTEPPPRQDVRFFDSIKSRHALQGDLRQEPMLAGLSREFYPELSILDNPEQGAVWRAELHVMEQTIQFIEEGWIGLGMKGRDDATISRAWLNTFRRLTGGERFRLFWPLLRSECSPEFVRFCERRLRLDAEPPRLEMIGWTNDAVAPLGAELAREWPEHLGRRAPSQNADPRFAESLADAGRRYLWDRINRGTLPSLGDKDQAGMRTAWLIYQRPIGFDPAQDRGFDFPLGIVVVFRPEPPLPVLQIGPESQRKGRPIYELFYWVRPAHRSAGVGEQILRGEEINAVVSRLEAEGASLLVRYPAIDGTSDEDLDRVRWLAFFSLLGFAPDPSFALTPNQSWVLFKDYDPPKDSPKKC